MTHQVTDESVGTSVLIVDDTPENLELLSDMLKASGCETRPVPSGRLALMAAESDPPDLILLDINMPEMDGYEVCERLKSNPRLSDIPVIFISAYSDTLDKVKAFSLGAVDYVTKPFQEEEVVARVRAQLQLRLYSVHLERVVEERTRDLVVALEKIRDISRIKDDFLHMMSHELRTPANGLFGISQLLFSPDLNAEDIGRYRELYDGCTMRLLNLIEDATLLAEIENHIPGAGERVACSMILDVAQTELADVVLDVQPAETARESLVSCSLYLLARALRTVIRLACAFSKDKRTVRMDILPEARGLRIRIPLDYLLLSEEDAENMLKLETDVRGRSSAETLGLAPVVAHRILVAHGGDMRLIKEGERSGRIELCLPVVAKSSGRDNHAS